MKKVLYLMLFIMLSFTINVRALSYNSSELKERSICPNFELAKANSDGSITSVSCFTDYASAKNTMDENEDNSLIILERNNNITKIIDAKYALVYLDKGDVVTYLYSGNNLKTTLTYMDNYSGYGATDGAFLELNYSNKAIKIKIGGVVGWVKNGAYEIIPINYVKSSSFYRINDKGIYHYYAKNIENNNYSQSNRHIDDKPKNIANGDYKSYDGIYFYSDFISMIDDYRTNKHEKAVNKDNPYYNYYQYLPHRSKTNYDILDFDDYIRNVLNFKGSLYGKFLTNNNSIMYGTSEYYLNAEKMYGANALSIFSLARHESGNGRSSISYNKNNLFGHNAVDGSAYSSATGYLDARSSIYTHGYGYINYGYARFADSRYYGSHFGNKYTGMNVQYASDVYWGEKAASYYYSFDKENGLLDKDYYQLIVSTHTEVNVRVSPKTSSKSVYTIKRVGIPFIVLEEVHGETVGGSDLWYKIQADSNIDKDGNLIPANKSTWPNYNWNGAVYVHSNYFMKINDGKKNSDGKYNSPLSINKDINSYTITTNASVSKYTPEVGIVNSDKDFYYTMTLTNKKGTIKSGSLVVILEKSTIDDTTNYLVITDYSTNQKAWISGKDVRILEKPLVSVIINESKKTIPVYDKPNGNVVLNVYNGNFLPIVDKLDKDGKTYLKVEYKIVGEILYGYIDSSIANIEYSLESLNLEPVITASDTTIILGNSFDPLNDVKATDNEDGDITKKIKVISNNVDVNKAGTYDVKYSVTDSFGNTSTKSIKVSVIALTKSNSLFMFEGLTHVSDNTFNFKGFMGVKGMNNKDVKHEMIFVNEITGKEYVFPLTKWEEYPYEMSDIDDKEKYDYSGGWFNTNINLSKEALPNGNYHLYVHVVNGTSEAKTLFTNVGYLDMTRRAKGNEREFMIEMDFSSANCPLVFSVRDNLISLDTPKTVDPMYNFFTNIQLDNNKLTIKGTSHSYGVSFGANEDIKRTIILENVNDFTKYEFDLGSITNGDYQVSISDNLDKTRAWYSNTIDLTEVKSGNYVVYIKNTVNKQSYYGELIDVAYTDFSKISNENYIIKRNDNIRVRVEIEVKK